MRHLFATALFGLLTLWSTLASADYVCSSAYIPGSQNGMGTKGYVHFVLYSAANCTGIFLGTKYLCSEGATNLNCPVSYLYSETGITNAAAQLRDAVAQDQRVLTASAAQCISGSWSCTAYVLYYGN